MKKLSALKLRRRGKRNAASGSSAEESALVASKQSDSEEEAADAAPASEEAGEAPVTPRRLSSAEKFGNDATPDARKDQLNDRITPLKLMQEDDRAMLEDSLKAMRPEDEMDARDAAAHRKKTAVWQLKQKRAARAGETSTEEFDRGATFDPLELERRLLRDRGEPGVVWTMGDDSLGQCGHAAERPDGVPYPAILGAKKLNVCSTSYPRSIAR